MFCPKCATQNADDAKYCRGCGADISLVPQAVTGHLAERLAASEGTQCGGRRGRRAPPSIERAVRSFFSGVAFICVAFAALSWAPAGETWWFWLLIPAIAKIGEGVAVYLRLREDRGKLAAPTFTPAPASLPDRRQGLTGLPPQRHTGEMARPPVSVTENTTRHLASPVERAPKDV
jgi:hypothetical protein